MGAVEWTDVTRQAASDFVRFAETDGTAIPMYARLVRGAAADPAVLSILEAAPPGQRRPVLLMAALHDLVLAEPSQPLARWYPSVTGGPVPLEDPWPTARQLLMDRRADLEAVVSTLTTQTNEPNRSAIWYPAMRAACADLPDTPVALLELGPSAGLNLRWDHYLFTYAGDAPRGNPASAVDVTCEIRRGTPPLDGAMPAVVARVGIDRDPVPVGDERRLRWLRACLWPEQAERLVRFDAAVAELRADPPRLVRGDAVDELADTIESMPAGTHLIVFHSWFLTYVARPRRPAIDEHLALVAGGRPVTRLSFEAAGVTAGFDDVVVPGADPDEFRTILGMTRWRGGTRSDTTLGAGHAHGAWLDWLDWLD